MVCLQDPRYFFMQPHVNFSIIQSCLQLRNLILTDLPSSPSPKWKLSGPKPHSIRHIIILILNRDNGYNSTIYN